jgi:hypothetical protein
MAPRHLLSPELRGHRADPRPPLDFSEYIDISTDLIRKMCGNGRRLLTPITNVLVFVVTIGVGIVAGGVLAATEAIEKRLTRTQR